MGLKINVLSAQETDLYYLYDKSVVDWRVGSYQAGSIDFVAFGRQNDMLIQVLGEEDYITVEYREFLYSGLDPVPTTPTKTKKLQVVE